MHIDLDVEPSRPAPDREEERPREPERRGHRREYDPREPRREFSDRVDGVVRDVAAFRAVAQADLINVQFDGHSYAGLKGIAEAERAGWIERHKAQGPKGGSFTVVVATPAGAARAAILWARAGREDQRGWSGAVKASDLGHECAVYRAACAAAERIEAAGGRVERVRVDAELKGRVAAHAERARQAEGREAAEAERCRGTRRETTAIRRVHATRVRLTRLGLGAGVHPEVREGFDPGFPFWTSRPSPLYTQNLLPGPIYCCGPLGMPSKPSAGCARRSRRANRRGSGTFLRHLPHIAPCRRPRSRDAIGRQPAGTGSAQIRWSIAPNSRRVRWLSASRSQ